MSYKINGETKLGTKLGTSFISKVTSTKGNWTKEYWRARYAAPGCNASPQEKRFPYTAEGLVAAHDWLGAKLYEETTPPPLEPLPPPVPPVDPPNLLDVLQRLLEASVTVVWSQPLRAERHEAAQECG